MTGLQGQGTTDGDGPRKVMIGPLTETETNPFFATLREPVADGAEENDTWLIALAGRVDGDSEGQVGAGKNLIARRVQGILITSSNTTRRRSALAGARRQGIW